MTVRTARRRKQVEEVREPREPSIDYVRNKEIPFFFGKPLLKGSYHDLDADLLNPDIPELFYSHPNGEIWVGDSIAWLGSMKSESVDLIFADPPYNIKKAEWDTFESQQEYVNWSLKGNGRNAICPLNIADVRQSALISWRIGL